MGIALIVLAIGVLFRIMLERRAKKQRWSIWRVEFLTGIYAALIGTGGGAWILYSPRYHNNILAWVIVWILVIVWDFIYLYYLPRRAVRKRESKVR